MSENEKKVIFILGISLGSGGAEKVISLLLKELVSQYNVHLILFYNRIHFEIPVEVEVNILSSNRSSNRIINFPISTYKYLSLLHKHKPQFVISFLTRPNILNGVGKIFQPKTRVIISERGFPSINYKSSNFRYWLYKILIPLFYNKADLLFSNSTEINKDLANNFRVNIPMKIIYNPVILQAQKSTKISSILKVITVGSLRPIKNQAMLINSMKYLPYAQLTLLGDGPLKIALKSRARDLGVNDQVNFQGNVRNVTTHLIQNDCFVLSSNSEGFPNALLEAMAVGLPVISTNCLSGPLEILNENVPVKIPKGQFFKANYGLLTNVGDVKGLVRAIDYFNNSENSRVIYGNLAYNRAKAYNLEYFYNEFFQLIETLEQ